MTLADKITTLRVVLAPVFFVVYFLPFWTPFTMGELSWTVPVLWVLFIVAELTDMFDGMAARGRNEVSDFGKLYDPFADTLVQLTFFLCFILTDILPPILFLVVLYREFAILFVRNLMLRKGIAMGARMSGKIKTVSYITALTIALAAVSVLRLKTWLTGAGFNGEKLFFVLSTAAAVVFAISVLFSVLSFADYIKVYRQESRQK